MSYTELKMTVSLKTKYKDIFPLPKFYMAFMLILPSRL